MRLNEVSSDLFHLRHSLSPKANIALGSNDDSTDYDEVSLQGGLVGEKYSTISIVNLEALSPR